MDILTEISVLSFNLVVVDTQNVTFVDIKNKALGILFYTGKLRLSK